MNTENRIITTLQLGRNTHEITKNDRFLNNGVCVQLVKENPLKIRHGASDTMTLSQADILHIENFNSIIHTEHEWACHGLKCKVFSLLEEAELAPFIVLYTDENFNVPEGALFMAEDSGHAEEQMLSENPSAVVTWIVQTNDISHAFDVYHAESTCEDA
jgi:hypothetical protein